MAKHGVTQYLDALYDTGMVFFEICPDLLIMLDESGLIKRVNPAFVKHTGYKESEVLGRGIIQVIAAHDAAAFFRTFTSKHRAVVRLLHRHSGNVRVRLVAFRFRNERSYLEFRVVE